MLKLIGLDWVLPTIGYLYLLLMLAAIGTAMWRGRTRLRKTILALGLFALFMAPVAPEIYRSYVYRQKLTQANALFEQRCKSAGEKFYRNIENVDGVLLMKIRPKEINFSDQYRMDDPYGRDVGELGYIESFLRTQEPAKLNSSLSTDQTNGFLWVEVDVLKEGEIRRLRYTAAATASDVRIQAAEVTTNAASGTSPRYGITYEDISSGSDRANWIAGGRLQVVDLHGNQVVAERIGYILDRGQGSTAAGRGPWEAAVACLNADRKYGHNARFAFRALKPN